ncbi:UDP-glucuronosyltransferase 1-7C-like isoform X7 [Photinus pyralis]|nr:UDP-glucuronosyltransferase 1-7C-like isoform X7 [Photinus pyralis]
MSNWKYVVILSALSYGGECLKILGIFTYNSISHSAAYIPILERLRADGHSLKLFATFSLSKEAPGDVILGSAQLGRRSYDFEQLKDSHSERIRFLHLNVTVEMCRKFLASKYYEDILQSEDNYDVFITEYFTTSCCITPIVQKLRLPFVVIQTSSLVSWSSPWINVPDNPSYIPVDFMELSRSTFWERFRNTMAYAYSHFFYYTVITPRDDALLDNCKHCTGIKSHDAIQNTSLILVNSHYSLHGSRPLPPHVVEVGGIHIQNSKPLPKHIDKWINESKHGVIYFSLGSMIKGHTFPDDKKQMFINAFGRLPQRVLWKWENETMPGKTDNIMIEKWMPQFDILCHPNVKAFIAHGGMLGVTEAVHCGVPMIIMPQFGDQFTNAKAVEASGGGTILDYRYLDEESIYNALTTALDPKSNKKAKELSARFKDRPLPPLETSIYWIEYVARHGGAPHLRTAAVGMPLYQYLLLDVIAFLVVILFSFLFVVYYISRAILRKLCRRKQSSQKKKKH